MSHQDKTYRQLQQHLNKQPVGFPASRSGADIRLLERLFTPDEARLALHLTYRPTSTQEIVTKAQPYFPESDIEHMLEGMFMKGSIARKEKNGVTHWYVVPMIIGMYEFQDGVPSIKFLRDAGAHMKTFAFGKSLLSVKPQQMRTIPINKSITAEHHVAPYDEIRSIISFAAAPLVVFNCACRVATKMQRKTCTKTERSETCLAFGNAAAMILRRKHGREITKDEALAIAEQNEADGLVFQPAGVKNPEFICSCCGCCCGMLGMHKKLPHPADFWVSNYYVQISEEDCKSCGKCVSRCQVNAITLADKGAKAKLDLGRCIGCGLCVSTCAPKALRLVKKEQEALLPDNDEALFEEIKKNRKSALGEWAMMLKVLLGMRQ